MIRARRQIEATEADPVYTKVSSRANEDDQQAWKEQRSSRIFEVAQYNWIIIPLLLALAYQLLYRLLSNPDNPYFYVPVDDTVNWNRGAFVWLLVVLPGRPFHHFSMLATCWPCRPFRLANKPAVRQFNRLLICLVTRGEQEQVVWRSLTPLLGKLSSLDPRVSLHILTEERNAGKFRDRFAGVIVHGVPADYTPKFAKYKARSLEWFRIKMTLQDDDWVLHIDEETLMDEYSIKKCIEFITRQDTDEIGTGVIHYNIESFWTSFIPTIGDLSRVQDDWGRCQWAANGPHRASIGIHGAFFLTSGKVENAVTWETAHLTEDYWFLLNAMKRNFRIGWVPAIARELSPRSIGDYVSQRRRWYTGIRTLGEFEGMCVLFAWAWGWVRLVFGLWRLATGAEVDAVPRWVFVAMVFEVACFRLFTALTLFVQDWDGGVHWSKMVFAQVAAQVLRPYVDLLDSYAVMTSLLAPDKEFYIVKKE